SDLAQRAAALNPARSFIVQAPAGSGKTELLIQRFLVLLSTVQRPEEITAITFTRKAAAEMRRRVIAALASARNPSPPVEPHEALTWGHARKVLEQDAKLGWKLLESAARLRIQTIDSLSASLTRQMPVLARFGAQPESVEDASALFHEAARNTLALLEGGEGAAGDVAILLSHLDNNAAVAENLLAGMLARRDHWIDNLRGAGDRAALEAALADVLREVLLTLEALVPEEVATEMIELAAYAAENLAVAEATSPLRACFELAALPATDETGVDAWHGLADLVLTKKNEWRKKVDINTGFPPGKDAASKGRAQQFKLRHASLMQSLADRDEFLQALAILRLAPPPRYADEQWRVLGSIVNLLPRAILELKLVFAAHGQADFVEIAQGALAALGTEDAPTDLLLSFDYRIRHILVDEFQDTSFTQFQLLKLLTAGWQLDDGRTLFVVGDPMQSIYRFRQAEVGLFLRARQQGIGSVQLEALTLSANFRSQAGIVEWVNAAFARVMPAAESVTAGAVPYTPSHAVHPAEGVAVRVHAFFDADAEAEAARVASLIRDAQAANPDGTIAVLVRGRSHLRAIVPRLKSAGQRFRAIEIEPLGHRQVVQDLLSLTRALSHLADRTAWLAVLRAPWCGLTLADLCALVEGGFSATVWELMADEQRVELMGAEGGMRLARVRNVLTKCLAHRARGNLRDAVEGAWLALGGPACVEDVTDLEDAEIFLQYLEESEDAGGITDIEAFQEGMAKLFALPDLEARDTDPQILTIHKAKGLEFDTVIVPGLGRKPRAADASLFLWTRRVRVGDEEGAELLLAPIKQTGADDDRIYAYLAHLERERERLEQARLLYVAATRAKRRLHLLGHVLPDLGDDVRMIKPPAKDSLLDSLWPAVAAEFEAAFASFVPSVQSVALSGEPAVLDQSLRRLPAGWSMPAYPPAVHWDAPEEPEGAGEDIEFSWVGETARHVGSVVHRWLQRIADDELAGWDPARVERMRKTFAAELATRGIPEVEVPDAVARIVEALTRTLEDARGRWLLGAQPQARNEYRITASIDGERLNLVIDRTFVDVEGRRHIVDYKTSSHEGGDADGFLDSERERYRQQLERYAIALGGEPSELGLYFPLLSGWREWQSQK
ncbi:MAG: UvrD-helicase domain-containing protein, partial [Betaproteobacteria bacterium]